MPEQAQYQRVAIVGSRYWKNPKIIRVAHAMAQGKCVLIWERKRDCRNVGGVEEKPEGHAASGKRRLTSVRVPRPAGSSSGTAVGARQDVQAYPAGIKPGPTFLQSLFRTVPSGVYA